MPIYIVRWPDLSASLVRARNQDDLLAILDQVANSEGCEWSVYRGPLFIDFRLPAEWSIRANRPDVPVEPHQVVVGNLGSRSNESSYHLMELSFAEGDDGCATGEGILRIAFPQLSKAIDKYLQTEEGRESEGVLPEAELRSALHAELVRLLGWSWKRAQLHQKTDPISNLAKEMGMPIALAEKYADAVIDAAIADEDEGDDPDLF